MRTFRLLLVPLALFFALGVVPQAHADEPIAKSYLFEGRLDESGILTVTETIKFDAPPAELTQRIANRAPIDPDRFYVYGISDVSATGVEHFASRTEGDYTVLSMKPSTEVKITYKVTGTTRSEPGTNGDASVFTWRALQGLSVAVEKVSGILQVGAQAHLVDCTAGPPGTLDKCQLYVAGAHNSPTPRFESATRGVGEQVTFTVGFSAEQVAPTARVHEQWNLNRAFTIDLATAGSPAVVVAASSKRC